MDLGKDGGLESNCFEVGSLWESEMFGGRGDTYTLQMYYMSELYTLKWLNVC
jgi:hypothetical protein